MSASNTKDCFSECVGLKVVGCLFDAFPVGRRDLSAGTKTLVFEDGSGLTIATNGAFWRECKDEIARAVQEKREQLEQAQRDIAGVLRVVG